MIQHVRLRLYSIKLTFVVNLLVLSTSLMTLFEHIEKSNDENIGDNVLIFLKDKV